MTNKYTIEEIKEKAAELIKDAYEVGASEGEGWGKYGDGLEFKDWIKDNEEILKDLGIKVVE